MLTIPERIAIGTLGILAAVVWGLEAASRLVTRRGEAAEDPELRLERTAEPIRRDVPDYVPPSWG